MKLEGPDQLIEHTIVIPMYNMFLLSNKKIKRKLKEVVNKLRCQHGDLSSWVRLKNYVVKIQTCRLGFSQRFFQRNTMLKIAYTGVFLIWIHFPFCTIMWWKYRYTLSIFFE